MPTNIQLDNHYEEVLQMLNPEFSKYSDDDLEAKIQKHRGFLLHIKNPTVVLKRIEPLEREKLVRERRKQLVNSAACMHLIVKNTSNFISMLLFLKNFVQFQC